MNKRRSIGDVVLKKGGAGFIGEQLVIRLLENEYNTPCLLECGDTNCIEWANVEILINGEVAGHTYHVSECEMKDIGK